MQCRGRIERPGDGVAAAHSIMRAVAVLALQKPSSALVKQYLGWKLMSLMTVHKHLHDAFDYL